MATRAGALGAAGGVRVWIRRRGSDGGGSRSRWRSREATEADRDAEASRHRDAETGGETLEIWEGDAKSYGSG